MIPIVERSAPIAARVALAAAFLSAVADRLGFWGPAGAPGVAWGNVDAFLAYTQRLNPFVPASLIPLVGWTATVLEVLFALLLLAGAGRPWVALGSGILLTLFAIGMTLDGGIKSPLDASVFSAASAAFLLAVFEARTRHPGGRRDV